MGQKNQIRKFKFSLRIKDTSAFGGGWAMFFMWIAMIASVCVLATVVFFQAVPEIATFCTGERDTQYLIKDPVTKTFQWCQYLVFSLLGLIIVIIALMYFIGLFEPETAAKAKASIPKLVIALCLVAVIGFILRGVVELNRALVSSYLSMFSLNIGDFFGYFSWLLLYSPIAPVVPMVVMSVIFGIYFMLFLRTMLIAFFYMFSPLWVVLIAIPVTRSWASKAAKIFFESVFILLFFDMAVMLVAAVVDPRFGGLMPWNLVNCFGALFFLIAIWKFLFNPIGGLISGAMAGGAMASYMGMMGATGVGARAGKVGAERGAGWMRRRKLEKAGITPEMLGEGGGGAPSRAARPAGAGGRGEEFITPTFEDSLRPGGFGEGLADGLKMTAAFIPASILGAKGAVELGKRLVGGAKTGISNIIQNRRALNEGLDKRAHDLGFADRKQFKREAPREFAREKDMIKADLKTSSYQKRAWKEQDKMRNLVREENPTVLSKEELNELKNFNEHPETWKLSEDEAGRLQKYRERTARGEQLEPGEQNDYSALVKKNINYDRRQSLQRRRDKTDATENQLEQFEINSNKRAQEKGQRCVERAKSRDTDRQRKKSLKESGQEKGGKFSR